MEEELKNVRIILYNKEEILIYSNEMILINSFPQDVDYIYKNFFTDKNKNFFEIVNDKPVKICKLKKRICKMFETMDKFYILDVYGDVYRLVNNTLEFIFGSLCSIIDVYFFYNQFYILDKYKRLRICENDGKIISYEFNNLGSGIVSFKNKICSINDDKNGYLINEDIKETLMFKNTKIFITLNNLYVFSFDEVKKIPNVFEPGKLNFGTDGNFYRLVNDKLEKINIKNKAI